MNSYFNHTDFEDEKKKASKLPAWIWIIGVFGLIISIISGYFYGIEAVNLYDEVMTKVIIKDSNGEDTSLGTLTFSEFIGVYDNVFGYNFFDCEMSYSLNYNSTVKYNNAQGVYPNNFTGNDTVNYTVGFNNFNHYDLSYAKKSDNTLVFTFSSQLESGNLEARILRIDENYRVKENENGVNIIENDYVHEVARFSANKTESVTLTGGCIYVLAVGGESAVGSYSLKTETVPLS